MKKSVVLSIAGQIIRVSGDKSMEHFGSSDRLDVFAGQNPGACHDTLELLLDQFVDDAPFEPYLSFEAYNEKYCFGEKNGMFKVSIEKLYSDRNKFLLEQVSPKRFVTSEIAEPGQIWNAISYSYSFFCAERNVFSMHASCIVYKGEAVLFLGKSGTGKSTHTKLWYDNFEGATLLNDDCPLIKIGDEIMVHGSPWSGKTPCYKRQCYPLKAVVKLKQAVENNIFKLDKKKSIAAVFPSFQPVLYMSASLSDFVFDAISTVISKVPVYHFDCLPNIEAAMLSKRTIFGE